MNLPEISPSPAARRTHVAAGLGWLLTLGALGMFGIIADGVNDSSALTHFDSLVVATLHEHAQATPTVVAIFKAVTLLGSALTLTILAVAVSAALTWRGHHLLSCVWGIVFAGCLLQFLLKDIFQRQRPQFPNPLILETSWSFPSGHAMASLIGYGLLAYLLWLAWPRWRHRLIVVSATAMLILVIGFSRLYLGAHYFSDVVAGYAAGAVWLTGSISGIEALKRRGRLSFLNRSRLPAVTQGAVGD